MNENITKPLGFGEILDQTFRIIKSNFKSLFMITFLVMVPIFALQAFILSLIGRDLIVSGDSGQNLIDQLLTSAESVTSTSFQEDLLTGFVNILILFATPVLAGAITWAVKYAREGNNLIAIKMIRKALPRYWPLLGSTLLFSLILFGLLLLSFMAIALISVPLMMMDMPIIGFGIIMLFSLGVFIGVGLLIIRWSLYIPAVLFDKVAPGLGKSWQLTKKQTWKFFGLMIVLLIISTIISSILQLPLFFLGNSVLFHLLTNIISLISSIVFTVGYAVMYLDASVRQEGTDLKEMIKEYEVTEES
ncbi:hypothetical protein SAMN04487943_105224 [Gracilibacillus orientalis]|uniref:Membrane domain of glycerophosphoryl diester phosphodiesterase n=1 Tax=Gracilibacillus orientalis TaxID=334253 RepID=A0A1I4LVJ3_9BACI|nr:hypothetical protein [Gracilibacillus orientalis]SFL94816.1 hypothetical protein SAMN04487943_105224 [Gracilibacillus orientalis]